MNRYFALVSGENVDLAQAEIQALIQTPGMNATVSWIGQLGIIEATSDPVPFLLERAALLKEAGQILAQSESLGSLIHDKYEVESWDSIQSESSFCIRISNLAREESTEHLRAAIWQLGERIRYASGAHVSMRDPDTRILLVLTTGGVLVCKSIESRLRHELRSRRPGRMHFFHPSMMNSFLARAMCNLAGVMPNYVVLDPFCGGGGILYEIMSIGAKPVGIDLSWPLLSGANANLTDSIGDGYCLIQGDARLIPLCKCHCIVTDPPYGRSSSTRGSESIMLVKSLLGQARVLLHGGGKMCICASTEMNMSSLIDVLGMRPDARLRVPVHSGLTREVFVLRF